MTIKAVLRDGRIQPVDPIPSAWREGQELMVEEPHLEGTEAQIEKWSREMEACAAGFPTEEHDRFRLALDEIERESKDTVRREWGLS